MGFPRRAGLSVRQHLAPLLPFFFFGRCQMHPWGQKHLLQWDTVGKEVMGGTLWLKLAWCPRAMVSSCHGVSVPGAGVRDHPEGTGLSPHRGLSSTLRA